MRGSQDQGVMLMVLCGIALKEYLSLNCLPLLRASLRTSLLNKFMETWVPAIPRKEFPGNAGC